MTAGGPSPAGMRDSWSCLLGWASPLAGKGGLKTFVTTGARQATRVEEYQDEEEGLRAWARGFSQRRRRLGTGPGAACITEAWEYGGRGVRD